MEELQAAGFCSHSVLFPHYLMSVSHVSLSIHFTPLNGMKSSEAKTLVILMLSLFSIHVNHTQVWDVHTLICTRWVLRCGGLIGRW